MDDNSIINQNLKDLAEEVRELGKNVVRLDERQKYTNDIIVEIKESFHERINKMTPQDLTLKIQDNFEALEDRVNKISEELIRKKIIQENHKSILGFFWDNWYKIIAIVGCVVATWGTLEVAIKLPAQNQNIQQIKKEVISDQKIIDSSVNKNT